jgi:hypothetical protein
MAQNSDEILGRQILIPVHLLHGLLTFLLHIWLTLSIQHEKIEWSSVKEPSDSQNSQNHTSPYSLLRLIPYLLTIRGFSLAITEPRKSSLDFSLTFFFRLYKSKSSFVLILFIASLTTSKIKRGFRAMKTFCSIWYAFAISTILGSNKIRLLILSVVLLPVSLWNLLVAVIIDGFQLIPIFTLPIFILGFPRPTTFWSEKWFPTRNKKSGSKNDNGAGKMKHIVEVESVDWKIYSDIGSLLASSLARKTHKTKFCKYMHILFKK